MYEPKADVEARPRLKIAKGSAGPLVEGINEVGKVERRRTARGTS